MINLKGHVQSIRNSVLAKNIFVLVIGTIIAQFIPIIMQIFLRRIIPPEQFGAFSVFLSVVGIIAIAACFRYETTIVIAKEDILAKNIFALSFILTLALNLIIFIIILIFKNEIAVILNFPNKYSNWLYWIPLSAFLFSTYQIISQWLIRKKYFKSEATNKVARRASESISQLLFGINKQSYSLVAGDIIGNIVNVVSGFFQIKRTGFNLKHISIFKIKYASKKFIDFPKYNLLPTLLNTSCILIPPIIVNKNFSTTETAHFDLTRMVLTVPAALLATSISNVLFQSLSSKINNLQNIKKEVTGIVLFLSVISVFEIIFIVLLGEWAFSVYAGEEYFISGTYAKVFVFSSSIKLIVTPISVVLLPLKKLKLLSVWQTIYFFIILCLSFVKFHDVISFIRMHVIIDTIARVFFKI